VGSGSALILLLLGESGFACGASPKTTIDEQLAEVFERIDFNMGFPQRHVVAGDRVQHPTGQHDNHAGLGFDVTQSSAGPHLIVTKG
jgi:hypothetical protein